jgi:hypothetical protein
MNRLSKLILIGLIGLIGCVNNQSKDNEKKNSDSELKITETKDMNKEPVFGERIDGPANLRDSIKGKVILSIEDNQLVQCSELSNDWYQIGLVVPLTKEQYDNYTIKKGEEIVQDGELICTAIEDVELWMTDENKGKDTTVKYVGILGGYTHKNNIKPESIPEKELEKILNIKKDLTKDKFDWYLKNFDFEKHGLEIEGFEDAEQYMIYGPWIDDPSPIDRIRLVFDSNELIAVIHERPLSMKGKKSYDLVRTQELLVIKDFDDKELENFIENNKKSYMGVD